MAGAGTTPTMPDWGPGAPSHRPPAHYARTAAALLVVVAAAALVTLGAGPVLGYGPTLVLDVVLVAGAYLWGTNQGSLALRSAGARRLDRDRHPRLWNIAEGLAGELGMPAPVLYVIPGRGPNAMVCRARGPVLAVTESLLEDYTRTELEAVVAHCLVRLSSDDVERAALGVAVGPLGTRAVPRVGYEDDVRAAAVTRYPPALAGAIEKADPVAGRYAPFWFVGESAQHRSVEERVAALDDL